MLSILFVSKTHKTDQNIQNSVKKKKNHGDHLIFSSLCLFSFSFKTPTTIFSSLLFLSLHFLILLNIAERCVDAKKVKLPNPKGWIPPTLESLKFNVDGAARGAPGQAGMGGVLRDSRGSILCVFSVYIGIHDSVSAELYAIAKACSLCLSRSDLFGKKIVVVSDCKQVVAWINSSGVGEWRFLQVILDIRNMLSRLGQTQVEYDSRDTNVFADALAKRGAEGGDELVEWRLA